MIRYEYIYYVLHCTCDIVTANICYLLVTVTHELSGKKYSPVCVHCVWLDELGHCPQMTRLHMARISPFWACLGPSATTSYDQL